MAFILSLDQGTTSSRAILFDHRGTVCGVAQQEFTQIFPRPGWVEHDPNEIWSTQRSVAEHVLADANLTPADVAAVGITNQRETTVVWDRTTGDPVCNAIVWQDRRTAEHCERLRAAGELDRFRGKTGLVLDPYFSGTKLAWILEHVGGVRERAEHGQLAFGTVDSWLIWKLTSGAAHVTDVSNASRTLLFDIHQSRWDPELLATLRIPPELLPVALPSSGAFGTVTAIPRLRGVPITGVAGDQQAALFGQVCVEPGLAKNTYGTGCFLLMNTGANARTSQHGLLTTIAWQRGTDRSYALEGSIFIGGAVVQWLRDGLGILRDSADVESLARSVADSGGVYLVPAFAGLGAPHWDPFARGLVAGITRGTSAGHIARAALEGIAFQVADLGDAMASDSGTTLSELRVDGGAARNDLLLQIQADLLGVRVTRPTVVETTALGAAYLAGLSVGYWTDLVDIRGHWQAERSFEPRTSRDQVAAMRRGWRAAVERAKGWAKE